MLYDRYIKKPYNTYICSKQFGFGQNSSTCSALINLFPDVYCLRKNYNYIRLITLDLSKAFDNIQHSEIFKEISRCIPPLNEYVVDVLKCFLTSRSHYTSLGSRFSPPTSTNLGLPQGTKTGPIFFNYAVNDTFRCEFLMSHSTRITVYDDDNTPLIGGTYTGGDSALDIIHIFGDHFRSKNFSFNADKSSKMNFGRHDVPLISGIDRKSSVNLLGILFDEKLSFNDHVKCITKRATAKLYVVFRLRRIWFSIRELTLFYKALVLPTLTYCCSVWGGTSDETLRKIDRVQSKAVRLGISNEYTPIKDIIQISDEKLYRQILDQPENHVLHEILPKRATGTPGLREKRPPVEATKFEQEIRLFPSRILRSYQI